MTAIQHGMLGATLYVPVLRPNLLEVCIGAIPDLRSIVVCLEDSLREDEVEAARQRFASFLRTLATLKSRITVFVRPRSLGMLRWMLTLPHIEAVDGLVLPKVDTNNISSWLTVLKGSPHAIMPTIEGPEAFDRSALARLRTHMIDVQPRVTAIRIGGNDILSLIGARRSKVRTAYDGPLGSVIRDIAGTFIPAGFAVSAPVFEHYGSIELLCEEVERDIEHGLLMKTAIHPCQVSVIHACYRPRSIELAEARSILEGESKAVFSSDGSMCEPATHARWAANILARAESFGFSECDTLASMKVA